MKSFRLNNTIVMMYSMKVLVNQKNGLSESQQTKFSMLKEIEGWNRALTFFTYIANGILRNGDNYKCQNIT